jgi:hypothetical protein
MTMKEPLEAIPMIHDDICLVLVPMYCSDHAHPTISHPRPVVYNATIFQLVHVIVVYIPGLARYKIMAPDL